MAPKILVVFLGGYWFISAGVAAWIGRQRGRMIEGLGLGILMGPIGPILVALLPDLRKAVPGALRVRRHVALEPHPAGELHVAHEAHALPVAEVDAEHHGHGIPMRAEGAGTFEAWPPEMAEDIFRGDRDAPGATEVEGKGRLRIDWMWVLFYGGWSLFVVFCWLWLLVYV